MKLQTTTASDDDSSEAVYWLQMAKRVLSGELAPQEARAALRTGNTVTPLKRAARTRH